ncbi:MAG TPA: response regulator [Candidatus Peribacterales bacterium]|nr:response regulator [Candidatus Peribacterales bacterium]
MLKNKNILIAEDEKMLSKALTIKLNAEGYGVTVAEDGKVALETVEKRSFDLILLDIIMPRMDGFTFLEFLRSAGTTFSLIPVLVLSNLGQPEEKERAMTLGATEYLVKANAPFPKILETIQLILNRRN